MPVHKGDQEVEGTLFAADIQFYIGKHGDIMYKDRGKWKKLHIGNPLEVLTVDPATLFPYWAPVVASGGIKLEQGTYVGTVAPPQAIALPTIADPLHADIVGILPFGRPPLVLFRFVKKKTMQAVTPTWTYTDFGPPDLSQPMGEISLDTITLAANLMTVSSRANALGVLYHYSVWGT